MAEQVIKYKLSGTSEEHEIKYRLFGKRPMVDGISGTEWNWYVNLNGTKMDSGCEFNNRRRAVKSIRKSIDRILKATI